MSYKELSHFKITCNHCSKSLIALLPALHKSIYSVSATEILTGWCRILRGRWDNRDGEFSFNGLYDDFCSDCFDYAKNLSKDREDMIFQESQKEKFNNECLTEI